MKSTHKTFINNKSLEIWLKYNFNKINNIYFKFLKNGFAIQINSI